MADPMICVHGLGESSLCFVPLASSSEFSTWSVLLPDLPGYGRSQWLPDPHNLEGLVDLVGLWLEEFKTPAVLVGHSMGGVIVQMVAERNPTRVRAVINVEGNLSEMDCTFSGRAAELSEAEFLDGGFERLQDWIYEQGLHKPAFRRYFASLQMCDGRAFFQNSLDLVRLSRTEKLAPRLSGLPMPHLYIAGLAGGVSQSSKKLLDRAKVNWCGIEGAGHWPFIDRPQEFLNVVDGFLRSLG